jgi:NAD(P)-dependent dehydrogenase (short-subunit alcohol dehydrogenase family)
MAGLRLANKVAVVTGAGSGIGRATALLFAQEGAAVVGCSNEPADHAPLVAAAEGSAGTLTAVEADVSREEDVRRLIRTAVDRHGGLDILVNNAGIVRPALVTEETDETWQRLIDVNLKGVLLGAKHAIPEMLRRGGGAIVNVSSINGIRGNHRLVAYSATKGGVVAMTRALALDYATANIRVNCVCPGTVEDTRQVGSALVDAADREETLRYLVAKHPMGRLGRPEEVARAILFLASDEASFITGVALPIDGGRSIR